MIKAQKFDEKNGLDITFQERTPDAYATQFNSGEFKIGGSASLTTLGLADMRGVKVKYLFNLFDFWGAVVTSRDSVKTLKDLEGKELAGARSTTNYQMFEFFAKKQGVDVSKIKVVNTAPPGLISYAIADRADAVQIWEPAYTLMLAKKPSIRTHRPRHREDLEGVRRRHAFRISASARMPTGPTPIRPRCRSSTRPTRRRRNGSQKNPDEAAPLLAKGAPPDELKAVAAMIRSNERLGMKLVQGGRRPQGDRGGLQGRHGDQLSAEHAVGRVDLRQAAEVIASGLDDASVRASGSSSRRPPARWC